MSGKTKRILYRIADLTLFALAAVAMIAILLMQTGRDFGVGEGAAGIVTFLCIVLQIPAAIHELGHLIFGWFAGMKCASVTLSYLRFGGGRVRFVYPSYAGSAAMYPKNGNDVSAKAIAFTVGGAVTGFLAGGVLLALFLALPYHPALLFCGLFAPFLFYESLRALIPAELPAGKTDGAVLMGLIKKSPEEDVMLRVLAAQGILYRGTFSDIPKELLFEAPVVREDLPAFLSLLMLRMQDLLSASEEEGAEEIFHRLYGLGEYLSEEEAREAERYGKYFTGAFERKPSPLHGVNVLEEALARKNKNSAAGQNKDLLE